MKKLKAGQLRQRITIEAPQYTQDATTGEIETTWLAVAQNIPASIDPLSAREFIAAQSTTSKISSRIVIRYRPNLTPDMRIIADDGTIYNPEAFIPDLNSGREYLTIPCSTC